AAARASEHDVARGKGGELPPLPLWAKAYKGRGGTEFAEGGVRDDDETHSSLNDRMNWSLSGFIRYDIMVRSPVCTKASTGMPGMIFASPRRATSSGGIETRIV